MLGALSERAARGRPRRATCGASCSPAPAGRSAPGSTSPRRWPARRARSAASAASTATPASSTCATRRRSCCTTSTRRRSARSTAAPPATGSTSRSAATSASRPTTAKLNPGFAKRGILPESGGTWLLPRMVGYAKAAEIAFTGRTLAGRRGARARTGQPRRRAERSGQVRRRAGRRDRRQRPARGAGDQADDARRRDRDVRAERAPRVPPAAAADAHRRLPRGRRRVHGEATRRRSKAGDRGRSADPFRRWGWRPAPPWIEGRRRGAGWRSSCTRTGAATSCGCRRSTQAFEAAVAHITGRRAACHAHLRAPGRRPRHAARSGCSARIGRRRVGVQHDSPSFAIDALPAEAFEALLVVAVVDRRGGQRRSAVPAGGAPERTGAVLVPARGRARRRRHRP